MAYASMLERVEDIDPEASYPHSNMGSSAHPGWVVDNPSFLPLGQHSITNLLQMYETFDDVT